MLGKVIEHNGECYVVFDCKDSKYERRIRVCDEHKGLAKELYGAGVNFEIVDFEAYIRP